MPTADRIPPGTGGEKHAATGHPLGKHKNGNAALGIEPSLV